jgi:murein DD-endopeptidase MepM/ murein hydrolase activator NlpD
MPLKKTPPTPNIQGFVLLLVMVMGGAMLVLRESAPALEVSLPVANAQTPTVDQPSWQDVLQQQFVENATPLPTRAMLPTEPFVVPTVAPIGEALAMAIQPTQLFGTVAATATSNVVQAASTQIGPTPIPATSIASGEVNWQPPPLQEPMSRDIRDHFYFARPVDSDAVNYPLFYYTYGADGPENLWRVHHGIDMPNPIGESVRAAGSGTVVWAADSFRVEQPDGSITEVTPSYGNTVLIRHDFGYRGQTLYTLYAHLATILVAKGQRVQSGDIIGLVGDTGYVSGSHVHFEVRLGQNSWYAVRNPILWMVPYAGQGIIAGRVIGPDGELLYDQDISIIDRSTGRVVQTTTSYVVVDTNNDRIPDINHDDDWDENFAVGDIPEGRYQVVTRIEGLRVSRQVDVYEGTTTFVELYLPEDATPQSPVDGEGS